MVSFTGGSPGKPRFLISGLCIYLESYLPPDQIREVYRAYLFSAEAHEGQMRKSGEPYIYHPVAVARILARLRIDQLTDLGWRLLAPLALLQLVVTLWIGG